MKKSTTKRALIMSVLSLLLCFSMLIGTTFAWFTDEVKSGVNTIVAGNLDVELYHADKGTNGANEEVDGNTKLFDDVTSDLWEPGAMAYEKFTVANAGNLALKYQLTLNALNATEVVDADGKKHSFASMLKVAVVEDANYNYSRDTITADTALVWEELATFSLNGELLARAAGATENPSKVHGIIIWWQPSDNDNLFNMNNANSGKKVSVEVGVNLFATQLALEADSFGPDYDEGAPWTGEINVDWYDPAATEYVLGSAEELAGLAAIVNGTASTYSLISTAVVDDFAGKTIKLGGDIDLNNVSWTPIGNFTYDITTNGDGYVYGNTFKGTFDGQGHTIKNLYVNAPNTSGVGLFGYVTDATVTNLTIENVKLNALSHVAAFVARARGTSTVTNCNLTGDIDINAYWAYVAGIVGKAYAINLDGCSVAPNGTGKITSENRNAVGSILAWMESASTVSNCEAQDLNLTGWANIGAISGFVNNNGTVANCSAKNITLTKTRADGIGTIGLAAGGWSGNNITIKDNTFDTISLNGTMVPNASVDVLFGGEFTGNGSASTVTASNNTQTNITDNRVEVTAVSTADALKAALANGGNIVLSANINGIDANTAITIAAGNDVTLDLNGHKITATADKTGNQELFLVKGTMTVKNGSLEFTAENNQGWNAMATIFDVTAGGVLKVEGVTANVSGTDMNFFVHLNNWGSASLEMTDCDITTTYVAVRAFNSGYDMNTVTIKDTDFHNGRMFWVHNYTSEGKDDSTLTLDIYGNNNTSDNAKPVRFGFSVSVYYDINGNLIP